MSKGLSGYQGDWELTLPVNSHAAVRDYLNLVVTDCKTTNRRHYLTRPVCHAASVYPCPLFLPIDGHDIALTLLRAW